ncbi:growth hormone-inducible transmembrane protein-like [Diaphorina citri]|uniref:Growth hormone-inducible transmembrane protein-like n=1 Tax=Diaphorina citri TaxID=121845 RepID=A0A3Q0IYZ6_DIACI|nr:growth hormone-inducible transmembrane protein-like [Diaphorina citri]
MLRLVSGNSMLAMFGSIALLMGSGMLVQSLEYKPGFGAKQIAWALHSALVGAVVAPICFIGGPVLIRAAWYTAGIVGGLSTVAACAPSDKFLTMGGPLAIGLGVVFASSIGKQRLHSYLRPQHWEAGPSILSPYMVDYYCSRISLPDDTQKL